VCTNGATTKAFDIHIQEAKFLYPKLVGNLSIPDSGARKVISPTKIFLCIPKKSGNLYHFLLFLIDMLNAQQTQSKPNNLSLQSHMQNNAKHSTFLKHPIQQCNLMVSLYMDDCITNVMEI